MTEYHQKRAEFKSGPFSESQVNQLLDAWSSQIRTSVIEASEIHDDAISLSDWEKAVSNLRDKLKFAREN